MSRIAGSAGACRITIVTPGEAAFDGLATSLSESCSSAHGVNAGHLVAVAVVPDFSKNKFILCTNALPETSALFAQKADAFGSTEPSTHHLRFHAVPLARRNEIVAELR